MDPKLAAAAKTGDTQSLHCLIERNPFLLEIVAMAEAGNPLHIASMCGHLAFVHEILALKNQFARELNQDGFTPLHLASANGHLEIVHELLKIGHDLCTIKGFEDRIALHCAVVKGRIDVIKKLVMADSSSGSTFEMKTARGETSLHLAVKNNQLEAFKVLLQHVKESKKEHMLNEKDEQGNTVLHHAASRKQYQVIKLLLVSDQVMISQVDINIRNNGGMAPLDVLLLFQSEAGDLEIHTALVEAGAKRSHNQVPFSSDHPLLDDTHQNNTSNSNNQLINIPQDSMKNDNNHQPRTNDALMTVFALVITATYQAMLSPPGGLWQDHGMDRKNHTIFPGQAILATEDTVPFAFFIVGNTIGFYLALAAIFYLIGTRSNRALTISLNAISLTYSFGVSAILPCGNGFHGLILGITLAIAVITSIPCFVKRLFLPKFQLRRRPRENVNP